MSAPRDLVTAGLTAQVGVGLPLEGVDVIAYSRSIDPPANPTVLVRLDEVEPHPEAPQALNLYHFALILIPTVSETGAADDELDDLLEDVLYAIFKAGNLTWSKAVRGTYQDTTYPAFEITLDVPINKEL